jgi:hypothetical protein
LGVGEVSKKHPPAIHDADGPTGVMTSDQVVIATIAARLLPTLLTAHPRLAWMGGGDTLSASVNVARQIVELVKSDERSEAVRSTKEGQS